MSSVHTTEDIDHQNKWAVLLEVALVFAVMVLAFRTFGRGISDLPGSASVNQFTIFTLGAMGLILVLKRRLDDYGIVFSTLGPSFRLAFISMAILGPTDVAFWLLQILGTTPNEWAGSSIVSAVFLVAAPLVVVITADLPTRAATP
jgi:hypothetical protein